MTITDLKNKNTIIEGQVKQILLRELDMIYKQVGKCKLDISLNPWHPRDKPHYIDIPSSYFCGHDLEVTPIYDYDGCETQLFILKRLPIGIKRLKRKLVKKNKIMAAALDLYSQKLDSFVLARKHTNEVFMMTLWVLGIVASGMWSRILF